MADPTNPWTCTPIGVVRTPFHARIDVPHQPTAVEADGPVEATLELRSDLPMDVLLGLEGFQRIWLIFVFHRSEGWAAKVRPPRRGAGRIGVLATRAPHRPNPIGLSCVELLAVEGRTLRLRGVDLLDGTPVLDLKPYVPYADAFPDARAGWVDAMDARTGKGAAPGLRKPRHRD